MAVLNSITFYQKNFKFDTEKELEDLAREGADARTEHKLDGGNEYGITNSQFLVRLLQLALLFTGFSFCFWLTDFQAEYLGTDMYILFYANGVVCIISGQINLLAYPRLGLKWLVVITQITAIISSSYIILVQEKTISYEDEDQEDVFVKVSIPAALFFLSLAIQVGFVAVF